jgi:hypothetical protein
MSSLEGRPPKGMNQRVFPNLKKTHDYKKFHIQMTLFLWEGGNI